MNTGTGALGLVLGMGFWLLSTASANAEAHVAHRIHAESKTSALSAALPSAPAEHIDAVAPVDAMPRVTPPSLPETPKLRRMRRAEISPAMLAAAARVVRKDYVKPVGTQIELDVEGKHLIARIEQHYHPEGGPVKPWGFHHGVSLFCER